MAFTPGTNSYVTLAEAESYFEDRPDPLWTGSDEQKQSALMYATDWLNAKYRWRGRIEDLTSQSLPWPRYSARDQEGRLLRSDHPLCDAAGIPIALKNATCEVALAHLQNALNETLSRGGDVRMVQVGPIKREFFEGSGAARVTLPFITKQLRGLYRGSPSVATYARR